MVAAARENADRSMRVVVAASFGVLATVGCTDYGQKILWREPDAGTIAFSNGGSGGTGSSDGLDMVVDNGGSGGVAGDGSTPGPRTVDAGAGGSAVSASTGVLAIYFTAPPGAVPSYIRFDGELRDSLGGLVEPWRMLLTVQETASFEYRRESFPDGFSLRGSFEFAVSGGSPSWGCSWNGEGTPNDSANFITQGDVSATLSNRPIGVTAVQDPTSDGCGFLFSE